MSNEDFLDLICGYFKTGGAVRRSDEGSGEGQASGQIEDMSTLVNLGIRFVEKEESARLVAHDDADKAD